MELIPDETGLLYTAQINADDNPQSSPIVWRHMCALHAATRRWFEDNTSLDETIIDVMLAEDTRPRILIKNTGVLLIFRGINYQDIDRPEDMISLRMWVCDGYIYTTRRRDLKTVKEIIELIESGRGPRREGEFLTMITSQLYFNIEAPIDDLEECTALSEERITADDYESVADNLLLIRRRTAIYRRYIIPQRGVLEGLINSKIPWLQEGDRELLVESHDVLLRHIEILNDIKERTLILNEEVRNIHAERLNSTSYIFSIAATIFLPLGFLTGLMGINIGGMPGVENPLAFWLFVALCLCIVAVQVYVFKKLKWF